MDTRQHLKEHQTLTGSDGNMLYCMPMYTPRRLWATYGSIYKTFSYLFPILASPASSSSRMMVLRSVGLSTHGKLCKWLGIPFFSIKRIALTSMWNENHRPSGSLEISVASLVWPAFQGKLNWQIELWVLRGICISLNQVEHHFHFSTHQIQS